MLFKSQLEYNLQQDEVTRIYACINAGKGYCQYLHGTFRYSNVCGISSGQSDFMKVLELGLRRTICYHNIVKCIFARDQITHLI